MEQGLAVGTARHAVPVRLMFADGESRPPAAAAAPPSRQPRGFRAELGECVLHPDGALLLGLGRASELRSDRIRVAGAKLARSVDRLEIAAIMTDGFESLPTSVGGAFEGAQALAEGFAIGRWRPEGYTGSASIPGPAGRSVRLNATSNAARSGLQRGLLLGKAVNEARLFAATPPNICNPPWVARECRRLARQHGLRCRVIDAPAARRMGMGGLTAVGSGSSAPPCLVQLEYRPRRGPAPDGRTSSNRASRARSAPQRGTAPRLVLVGKTITYDTGGYSLKTSASMRGMKYDKCGGAAVLGALLAIVEARLPLEVVALLPTAENMISGGSYRPDDIITMGNGVTVEVTNTDAEGRLVLGDALAYACRTLHPTALVDVATLTGGVVTALGAFSAGFFCGDDALRRRIEGASQRSGERVWQLPLWPEHREFMRSQQADILNSHPKREAHPIQGAAFLSYFVDRGVPWAHLDIAGVNDIESPNDLMVAGPTGWGVRLLFELAASLAA